MKRMTKVALVMTLAVVVAADFAVAAQAGTARHDSGLHHRIADVTFTKWLTSLPNAPSAAGASMAGVVGGDVGPGPFAGIVLTEDTTTRPNHWLAEALYGFIGTKHSFVASNHIDENDTASPITARIRGVVTWGWRKGAHVTGKYTLWETCPISTPGNVLAPSCFRGHLHLWLRKGEVR
jgi:hypothetical protein